MEYRDFLIIGHPRGGTTYSSKLFKTFGFDVGHEKVNASGIASWLFGSDQGWNYWTDKRKRNEFYFKWTFLNVRNPLSIINSLITEHSRSSDSLDLVSKWTNHSFSSSSHIDLATERYLVWESYLWENNNIDFWFRVEDNQKEVYNKLRFYGYEPFYHLGESKIHEHIIARNINTRKKTNSPITLEDISPKYKKQIIEKMEQYGYSPES